MVKKRKLVLPEGQTLHIDCSTNQRAKIKLMRESFNTVIGKFEHQTHDLYHFSHVCQNSIAKTYGQNLTHNIYHMKLSDTGKYICTAETSCGVVERDIIVQETVINDFRPIFPNNNFVTY